MNDFGSERTRDLSRRGFLQVAGVAAAGVSLKADGGHAVSLAAAANQRKPTAIVRGAFLYPPTASLEAAGYYSWPGSSFDAEGHQRQYMTKLQELERDLGVRIQVDERPLDDAASVARFIDEVKSSNPDGLLLVPFKNAQTPTW